ncbi:NADP oxidoreductase [Demequina sp. SYSU T00192]|uniref:NADP oxidoreductase n=1 Tax=Demequina litoralis TaxID=3051660 RepID=A0ABT8GC38_9MICO|nr:NADP oxidoreductase [Demequina sp. SYSU T00192]MDN4476699.1 NADP oxidoreductase [Demequina sp. SYSU T00192]
MDDARDEVAPSAHRAVGILGAGRFGAAIARLCRDAGIEVTVASSGDDPAAACAADVVILAIPLGRYRSLPADLLRDRIVVDVMNHWWEIDGARPDLEDPTTSTSETVAAFLDGARVVKALNHASVWELENLGRPAGDPDRRGIAVAADDAGARAAVAALVDALGFDPVDAGPLAAGVMFEPPTEIFGSDATAAEIRAMLDRFPRSQRGRVVARARGKA